MTKMLPGRRPLACPDAEEKSQNAIFPLSLGRELALMDAARKLVNVGELDISQISPCYPIGCPFLMTLLPTVFGSLESLTFDVHAPIEPFLELYPDEVVDVWVAIAP